MIADGALRLARGFAKVGKVVRFQRRGEGLLDLILEDGARVLLDLYSSEIVETDADDDQQNVVQVVVADHLGWEFEKPERSDALEM